MINIFILIISIVFVTFTIGALVAITIKNTSIIDVWWALGPFVTAWICLWTFSGNELHIIFCILISMLSLRLGLFLLFTRIFKKKQDERYSVIESKWKGNKHIKTIGHFYMQAAFNCLLCITYIPLFNSTSTSLSHLYIISIILFSISLFGVTIADLQLYKFKVKNNTGLCKQGLWSICRHPNYFFEWLAWTSLALFVFIHTSSILAWSAPLSLFIIMRFMTGPYTEKLSLQKRKIEYKEYQKTVPMFFPSLRLIIKGVLKWLQINY